MEVHTFLLQIVLILISARIMGEMASYLKVPSVIGELVAGIIIGPSMLNWVGLTNPIYLLAEIGIILLLFEVGIETDLRRLSSSGVKALSVAIGGVVLPFVLGFCVAHYLFDLTLLISLFIGCTLTATSIGITLRVLRDLDEQNSNEAQIIVGAAVLDDIIGIILLSMLYEFSIAGEINVWNIVRVLFFMMLFFLLAPLAAKLVTIVIKRWDEKSQIPGLLPTTIISLVLFFSWLAHQLGAPELLGGFAAGLALSRQFFFPFSTFQRSHDFSERVEEKMRPIVHLFTPIFFVTIGLSIDLKDVDWNSPFIWALGGALLVAAVLGKLCSGFILKNTKWIAKWIVGIAMIPRGEVGLIFANVGLTVGVFKNDIYTTLVLVIVVTTLLAPFSLRGLFAQGKRPLSNP